MRTVPAATAWISAPAPGVRSTPRCGEENFDRYVCELYAAETGTPTGNGHWMAALGSLTQVPANWVTPESAAISAIDATS
jgi:rubredoxin